MNPRIRAARKLLQQNKIDSLLISSVADILYLSGFSSFSEIEREGYLLITKTHNYIITDGRYAQAVKQNSKHFSLLETEPNITLQNILKDLVKKEQLLSLGIQSDSLKVSEFVYFKKIFQNVKPFSLSQLRSIKSPEEKELIQKACKIGDVAFSYICKEIRQNCTEKELAWKLEKFIREQNAEISFAPIVAFGAHAAIPHHLPTDKKLQNNMVVLLDFGARYHNYCSDMTRTVFFGKASDEFRNVYTAVFNAQKTAIEYINIMYGKTILAKAVDKTAREYLVSKGFPAIPHSLGHGIGIEVHESPRLSPVSKDILLSEMVFSIEPGIYLPDKFGIRIEDLFALKKSGLEQLTQTPQEPIEITN